MECKGFIDFLDDYHPLQGPPPLYPSPPKKNTQQNNLKSCFVQETKRYFPEANIAPENQWLEDIFFSWEGLFSGAMLISGGHFPAILFRCYSPEI